MASDAPTSFAVRWARRLPGRWARNGAILGALFGSVPGGTSRQFKYVFENTLLLTRFIITILFVAGMFALAGFLLGLWARWSLSPIDEASLSVGVKTILRKWVIGAVALGVAMMLADVVLQWRGPTFVAGGTPSAIAENLGFLVGVLGGSVIVGLIACYISRRGLRKAIDDDRMRLGSVDPVAR